MPGPDTKALVRTLRKHARWGLQLTVLLIAVGSCVDEKIVYRNVQFPEPSLAAKSFVGYSQTDTKQTTCGNCHIDQQAKWSGTKHSQAWADLKASGHSTGACESCHSVNDKGNASTDTSSGYTSTKDARYQDVQCESCHGAGLAHVTLPSIANRPLASVAVKVGSDNGCSECHTGVHTPFVDEWATSRHGIVETAPSTRPECIGCHTAQGALAAFGVNTNYVEKTSTTPLPLTCAVCHDPHDPTQTASASLRGRCTEPRPESLHAVPPAAQRSRSNFIEWSALAAGADAVRHGRLVPATAHRPGNHRNRRDPRVTNGEPEVVRDLSFESSDGHRQAHRCVHVPEHGPHTSTRFRASTRRANSDRGH